MAQYTPKLNLYKPSRLDSGLDVDTTLAQNFQNIEDKLGIGLTDEDGVTHTDLKERLDKMVDKIGAKGRHYIATDENNIAGDGTNDDTAGIQGLLDKAQTATNGISIFFPAGIYKLTDTLTVYHGTRIEAHQNAVFLKQHNSGLLKNINANSTATGYDGNGQIAIIGGMWDNDAPNYSGGTSFVFGHGDTVHFKDLTIKDVMPGHGMEINACRNVFIDGCQFKGMNPTSGKEYSEAIQLDIMKGQSVFPWKNDYFDHTPCQNVFITNCYFGASDSLGPWGRAVGTHSSTIGKKIKNVHIIGNTAEGMLQWAFRTYNWENFTIANNDIIDCGQGINVRTPITGVDTEDSTGSQVGSEPNENGVIIGNIIRGDLTAGRAIEIYGEQDTAGIVKGMVVANNVIYTQYNTNDAIQIHVAEHINVSNNRIYGCSDGVAINDSVNVNVNGNVIDNSGAYGIQMYGGSKYITVTGNVVRRSNQSCIYATDAGTEALVISSNMLSGANGAAGAGTEYNHIRLTSDVNVAAITGNVFRNYSTYTTTHAVYVTSTCTNVSITGNNGIGFTLYNGATGGTVDAQGNIT